MDGGHHVPGFGSQPPPATDHMTSNFAPRPSQPSPVVSSAQGNAPATQVQLFYSTASNQYFGGQFIEAK